MSDGHQHHHASSAATAQRVRSLVTKLEERGITSEAALDRAVEEFLAAAKPANGARVVARAWTDASFKARLLSDANAALAELGLGMSAGISVVKLRVVENTADVHNVIVCTLCSCYPLALLGPSPSWYKSEAYRSRVVRDPRATLEEFGLKLDPHVKVRVWDSTAELRYMVLPLRPPGTQRLSEEELARLVSRDALIGTANVVARL